MQQLYEAIQDVQSAMMAVMMNDATLQNRGLTGIFDEAPAQQAYPYIAFGTKTQLPFDVFRKNGFDCTVTLDIYTSQWNGNAHLNILNDIYRLFNHPKDGLPLQWWFSTLCHVEIASTRVVEDMSVRHTWARVRTLET